MRLTFLIAALALAGCDATTQQVRRPTAADDPSAPCYRQLETDQRFAALKTKIGSVIASNKATVEMLASTEKPTEEERRQISVLGVARQSCADMGHAFRLTYAPPGYEAAFMAGQNDVLALLARLYAGELTYGEFNRERLDLGHRTSANMNATVDRAQANAQQSAIQSQQSALQSMQIMQMMQANRPAPQPLPLPAQPINCTSSRIGSQTYTNCR
jgi:hypothetical protein